MAIFIRYLFISFFLFFSVSSIGHAIFAPNDIPLLDNRFRIDPETEQITFIFNHSKGHQRVVLVQPDGSKLYQKRHPENIAWVSSKVQDIVTVQNPMAGPWQAIAELDGDNRIKLISKVQLKVNRLPLKLYTKEYITTEASLFDGNKVISNPAYLADAMLSISLTGSANKKMALYLDDGKHYDQLAFDGNLTAHLYVDLQPGRYLMSISTQNDVFIRNVNKDIVVFPSPINYEIEFQEAQSDIATLSFSIDSDEIIPESVTINGAFKDANNKITSQVMIHNIDNPEGSVQFSSQYKLPYKMYTFSGKAYATTHDGREIELQLPDRIFKLTPPFKLAENIASDGVATQLHSTKAQSLSNPPPSLLSQWWLIITISLTLLFMIAVIAFFLWKQKNKKLKKEGIVLDELNLDELQPMPIDVSDGK
ncbi:TIGR03503 family protein [Psychromonas marina]|uniref:TIGR03503 family protein n=1 Tax=Psychromonas marina TaxID=88364 RepID=A0ABQ6DWS5_9GAMM|nr:hypothetical protein [Psychromonas marina]GLS89601.1 TIGR03503 family protein [Psychromonas marina]